MLKKIRGSNLGFIDKHLDDLKEFNQKKYALIKEIRSRRPERYENFKYNNKEPDNLRKKEIYKLYEHIIKALNFGWRCYYLEGAELNYKR